MPRPDEEAESVAVVLADAFEMGKHLGPLVAGNNSSDELEQTQAKEAALPWVRCFFPEAAIKY